MHFFIYDVVVLNDPVIDNPVFFLSFCGSVCDYLDVFFSFLSDFWQQLFKIPGKERIHQI